MLRVSILCRHSVQTPEVAAAKDEEEEEEEEQEEEKAQKDSRKHNHKETGTARHGQSAQTWS